MNRFNVFHQFRAERKKLHNSYKFQFAILEIGQSTLHMHKSSTFRANPVKERAVKYKTATILALQKLFCNECSIAFYTNKDNRSSFIKARPHADPPTLPGVCILRTNPSFARGHFAFLHVSCCAVLERMKHVELSKRTRFAAVYAVVPCRLKINGNDCPGIHFLTISVSSEPSFSCTELYPSPRTAGTATSDPDRSGHLLFQQRNQNKGNTKCFHQLSRQPLICHDLEVAHLQNRHHVGLLART